MAFGANTLPLGPAGGYPKVRRGNFGARLPYIDIDMVEVSTLPAREKNFVVSLLGPRHRMVSGLQRRGIVYGGRFTPRYTKENGLNGIGLGDYTAKQQQSLNAQQVAIARKRAAYAWKMEQARMAEALRAERMRALEDERQRKIRFKEDQKDWAAQRKLEARRLLPDIKTQRMDMTQQFKLSAAKIAADKAYEVQITARRKAEEQEATKRMAAEFADKTALTQAEYAYKAIVEPKQAEIAATAETAKLFAPAPSLQDSFYDNQGPGYSSEPSRQEVMEYPGNYRRDVGIVESSNNNPFYNNTPATRASGPEMAEEYYEPFQSTEQFSPYENSGGEQFSPYE